MHPDRAPCQNRGPETDQAEFEGRGFVCVPPLGSGLASPPSPSTSARPMRCNLPVGPFGIWSTTTICLGTLYGARRSDANTVRSAGVTPAVGIQDDGDSDFFTERRVRHREGDRLTNRRVLRQSVVDLTRRDLFAAAIDHLLGAADDRKVAVFVQHTDVTRSEPSLHEGRVRSCLPARRTHASRCRRGSRSRPTPRASRKAPSSPTIAISGPAARPTVPGRRSCGGSGLLAIW